MTTPEASQPLAREQLGAILKVGRRMLHSLVPAIVAVVLGLSATAGLAVLRPRFYKSETVLEYKEGFQWELQEGGARRAGQRLRSTVLARTRLQDMVKEFGLFQKLVQAGKMDDAIEEMRRRITFHVNEGDTITVGFVGESPQDAQLVTKSLAQSLIADNLRLRSEQIEVAKAVIDSERQRTEALLLAKEADQAKLLSNHPELGRAGAPPPALPEVQAAPSPAPAPAPARAQAMAAEQLALGQLAAAKREYASQRDRFAEKHPAVLTAADDLKAAEIAHQRAVDALAALPPDLGAAPPRQTGGVWMPPRIGARTLEEDARLTREVAELRERLQQLDARQFAVSMAASSWAGNNSAQISVIDPAYLPVQPTGVATLMLIAIGLAVSFLLGLVTALIYALLDDRLYDQHDIEAWGRVRALGEVTLLCEGEATQGPAVAALSASAHSEEPGPRLGEGEGGDLDPGAPRRPAGDGGTRGLTVTPAGPAGLELAGDPRLVMLCAPDSSAAASYRILRHRLVELGDPRCILVTSPDVGEGKTTCALNLALALSEAKRATVLLLDAHLRRPALVGQRFPSAAGRPSHAGVAVPWAVIEHLTSLKYFELRESHEPQQVDALSLRFRLEELGAAKFDYIVIDGPPILGSADVNLLQETAGAVLITARAGRTQARSLRKAIDQLGARKVIGVVLIGSPA